MADPHGEDPPGATPLEAEDLEGLIPTFISTRADLNIAEQANIEDATMWAFRRRSALPVNEILSVSFVFDLHRRMFGNVWRWAGKQRQRQSNIGVEPYTVVTETKSLLDDSAYWHAHATYDPVELAVRTHHRLVSVHPFRNGNGRHARFMADLYLHAAGRPRLSWGSGKSLDTDNDNRNAYINALRTADADDIQPLVEFALS